MNNKIRNYGNEQLAYDYYNYDEAVDTNNFIDYTHNNSFKNSKSISKRTSSPFDINIRDEYINDQMSANLSHQITSLTDSRSQLNDRLHDKNNYNNKNNYVNMSYKNSNEALNNNSLYSPVANSSRNIDNTYTYENDNNSISEYIPSTREYRDYPEDELKDYYDEYAYDDGYDDYDDYDDYYEDEIYDEAEYEDFESDDKLLAKKKKRKKIIITCLSTLVAICAGVTAYAYHYISGFDTHREKPDEKKMIVPEKKGFRTIALIGCDASSEQGLADTIIVASINQETGEVKMASVARDLYLKISDQNNKSHFDKVNSSFNNNKKQDPKRVVDTVNENLGLSVKDYITVNFDSMAQLVDSVDGIEVTIPESKNFVFTMNVFGREAAENAGKDYEDVPEGSEGKKVKLHGYQALAYCRVRKSVETYKHTRPLDPKENDYTRSQRQKEVINLIVQAIKDGGLLKIKGAADVMRDNNNFSSSIDVNELIQLGKEAKEKNYHLVDESEGKKGTLSIPEDLYSVKVGKMDTQFTKPNLYEEARKIRDFLYDGKEDIDISKYQTVMEISDQLEDIENKYGEKNYKFIKKCLDANGQPIPQNTDWNTIKQGNANKDAAQNNNKNTQNTPKQNNAKQNTAVNNKQKTTNKKKKAR